MKDKEQKKKPSPKPKHLGKRRTKLTDKEKRENNYDPNGPNTLTYRPKRKTSGSGEIG